MNYSYKYRCFAFNTITLCCSSVCVKRKMYAKSYGFVDVSHDCKVRMQ